MNKLITLLFAGLLAFTCAAQAPQGVSYQAVLRNSAGAIEANASATLGTAILQGSENGPVVYNEDHSVTSNSFGLVNVTLGGGTVLSGVFANIDWAAGPYFVRTSLNGTVMGSSQLQSVPYALYAASGAPGPAGPQGDVGPAGPAGPAGADGTGVTILGSLDDVDQLPSTGNPGDSYLVDGDLHVWSPTTNTWESVGTIQGPEGPAGPAGPAGPEGPAGVDGTGVTILGSLDDVDQLPSTGNPGDSYLVDGDLHVWSPTTNTWESVGSIQGPEGPAGATGDTGAAGPAGPEGAMGPAGPAGPEGPAGVDGTGVTILGSLDDVDQLPSTGNPGDSYLVDGDLHVWSPTTNTWESVGTIQGPEGPAGPIGLTGDTGAAGPMGPQGDQGLAGPIGPIGLTGPAGVPGDTGAVGPMGPQGVVGPLGPQGDQGLAGPAGPIGLTGPAGLPGDTGAVGPMGPQGVAGPVGPQGDQGLAGPAGPIGLTGPTGLPGDTGAVGPMGPQGVAGPIGPQGDQGLAGPAGPIGLTGLPGLPGDTGAVGPMGPQGLEGPMGPIGLTGLPGLPGDTGAVGPMGPQGEQGIPGTAGAIGPQGDAGPAGSYSAGDGILISPNDEISAVLGTVIETDELQDGAVTSEKINAMGATQGQVLQYDGNNWLPSTPAQESAGWQLQGNAVDSSNFIGSTNNAALQFRVNGQRAGSVHEVSGNTSFGFRTLDTISPGNFNTALGIRALSNNTYGNENVAVGANSLASNISGSGNVGLGLNADVGSFGLSNATAIGAYSLVTRSNALVLGTVGSPLTGMPHTSVGIGTTAPTAPLEIKGTSYTNVPQLRLRESTGEYTRIHFQNANTGAWVVAAKKGTTAANSLFNVFYSEGVDGNGGSDIMSVSGQGKVGINTSSMGTGPSDGALSIRPTATNVATLSLLNSTGAQNWSYHVKNNVSGLPVLAMHYNGTLRGEFNSNSGAYSATSDIRLKENITPVSSVLEQIKGIDVMRYTYKADRAQEPQLGYIAQNLEEHFPEFVNRPNTEDGEDFYTVNYAGMSAVAIKAIQEQQQLIEGQAKTIEGLQEAVAKMQARLEQLER